MNHLIQSIIFLSIFCPNIFFSGLQFGLGYLKLPSMLGLFL